MSAKLRRRQLPSVCREACVRACKHVILCTFASLWYRYLSNNSGKVSFILVNINACTKTWTCACIPCFFIYVRAAIQLQDNGITLKPHKNEPMYECSKSQENKRMCACVALLLSPFVMWFDVWRELSLHVHPDSNPQPYVHFLVWVEISLISPR